jgi:hypothetical protein
MSIHTLLQLVEAANLQTQNLQSTEVIDGAHSAVMRELYEAGLTTPHLRAY